MSTLVPCSSASTRQCPRGGAGPQGQQEAGGPDGVAAEQGEEPGRTRGDERVVRMRDQRHPRARRGRRAPARSSVRAGRPFRRLGPKCPHSARRGTLRPESHQHHRVGVVEAGCPVGGCGAVRRHVEGATPARRRSRPAQAPSPRSNSTRTPVDVVVSPALMVSIDVWPSSSTRRRLTVTGCSSRDETAIVSADAGGRRPCGAARPERRGRRPGRRGRG